MKELIEAIEQARTVANDLLKTGDRQQRRKTLVTAKLLEKAAVLLGLERTKRQRPESVGKIEYPPTTEQKEVPEPEKFSDVIADNAERKDDDKPRRPRKPKTDA